ncbi:MULTISPECIES: TetR/AcrR family transcriptional regulator [Lactobacillaceae]|uniref:TetR/AcrR family transcriptional regulator n=1 Tax=Lactobacillaceae TaxID=33958 RepID=UPI0006C93AE2|nr:TetR/AcrR family transcriptional regulator [Lactiplantibacillus plantarum]QXD13542.1 TetR/AcrR family transcriptional regulator [Lactiplantibacillus plantarum 2025]
MKNRKTDRRTLYTLKLIKDAFLNIVNKDSFSHVNIARICREAEITRSTFYIHYSSTTDVLNDVLNDALLLTETNSSPFFMGKDKSFNYLKSNESLVPACQRIGDNGKYRKLLMDPDLSEYIIGRIMINEREKVLPLVIEKTHLSREEAETLFRYVIHGSFAVNRAHKFVKDEKWFHDVQMLNEFVEAGYERLSHN